VAWVMKGLIRFDKGTSGDGFIGKKGAGELKQAFLG